MRRVLPSSVSRLIANRSLPSFAVIRSALPHRTVSRWAVGLSGVALAAFAMSTTALAAEEKKTPATTAKKVVISGGPGSGKGTQSDLILRHYELIHVSTGDLLRDHVKRGTPEGKIAKEIMDKGGLVTASIMEPIVQGRLTAPDCLEKGWLLDGYPRELANAEFMKRVGLVPDICVLLEVPDEVLVTRLSGRVTDPVTKITYHMTFMPPPVDPVIRARLTQRSDDTADAARARVAGYKKHLEPVLGYYRTTAVPIVVVDGNRSVEAVFGSIAAALGTPKNAITADSIRAIAAAAAAKDK